MQQSPLTKARRTVLTLSALLLTVFCASCGGSKGDAARAEARGLPWIARPQPIPGLSQRILGSGPRAVVVLWPAGRRPPRPAVVFLHGWLPSPPSADGEWLRHLAREGNSIVYPVYQAARSRPETFRAAALAGISRGLRAVRADPTSVVAIGRTTGGALAFDYAAVASSHGIPAPRGVLAVFPGRHPGNGEVTPADLARIAPSTCLVAIAGPGDPIPNGEVEAAALLRGASGVPPRRKSLLRPAFPKRGTVSDPAAIHRASRRAFWAPADRLIAEVRSARSSRR